MSFNWNSVEQREQKKVETEKQLKNFLLNQQEDAKKRKQEAKMREVDEAKKILGALDERLPSRFDKNATYPLTGDHAKPKTANLLSGLHTSPTMTISSPTMMAAPTMDPPRLSAFMMPDPPVQVSTSAMTTASNDMSFSHNLTLKYLEDRLEQERRAREQLESELRLGKSLISQVSSRVELLQNQLHYQKQQSLYQEGDGMSLTPSGELKVEIKRQMDKVQENVFSRLSGLVADQVGIKSRLHDVQDAENQRYKKVLDELDQVKMLVQTTMSQTSAWHQDEASRATMMMSEQSKAAEMGQTVLVHDQFIKSLQKAVEVKLAQVDQSLSFLKMETTRLASHEEQLKKQVEQFASDASMASMKQVAMRVGPLETQVQSMSGLVREVSDLVRHEHEQTQDFVNAQVHSVIQKVDQNKGDAEELVKSRFATVEEWLSQEQMQAVKRDVQVRTDMESLMKQLEVRLLKEVQMAKEDVKAKFTQSIKGLQQAVHLVEETCSSKLERLEKVVKAEIEHRMDQNKRLDSAVHQTQEAVHHQETKFSDLIGHSRQILEKHEGQIMTLQQNLHEQYATKDHVKSQLTVVAGDLQEALLNVTQKVNSQFEGYTETTSLTVHNSVQTMQEQSRIVEMNMKALQQEMMHHEGQLVQLREKAMMLGDVKMEQEELKKEVQGIMQWKGMMERHSGNQGFSLENQGSKVLMDRMTVKMAEIMEKVNRLEVQGMLHQEGSEVQDIKKRMQGLEQVFKEQQTKLSFKMEGQIKEEQLQRVQKEMQESLREVQEKMNLAMRDVVVLEEQLRQKVDVTQFELIDSQVKGVKEAIQDVSLSVQEQASKQSEEVHRLLMELMQHLSAKQNAHTREVYELRSSIDVKLASVAELVHDHTRKNGGIEEALRLKIRHVEDDVKAQMQNVKLAVRQAAVFQDQKFRDFDLALHSGVEANAAYIQAKTAEFALRSNVGALESELKMMGSRLSDVQKTEKAAFLEMESRLAILQRDMASKPDSEGNSARDLRLLKDAVSHLQDLYDHHKLDSPLQSAAVSHEEFQHVVNQVNLLEKELYNKVSDGELRFKIQTYLSTTSPAMNAVSPVSPINAVSYPVSYPVSSPFKASPLASREDLKSSASIYKPALVSQDNLKKSQSLKSKHSQQSLQYEQKQQSKHSLYSQANSNHELQGSLQQESQGSLQQESQEETQEKTQEETQEETQDETQG